MNNLGRLAAGLMLLLPPLLHAQMQPTIVKKSQQSGVEFYSSNNGVFGMNIAAGQPGFFYPRGSGQRYLFGSGLWFGARKDRFDPASTSTYRIPLSFVTFNPNAGTSWATSGDGRYATDPTYPLSDVFNSLDYNHTTGRSTVSDTLPGWPLWVPPNRTPTTYYTGKFEPYDSYRLLDSAEYISPAFVPGVDEEISVRYHDADVSRYEGLTQGQMDSLGYPIGLQIQQNIYSWSSGPLASTVVVQYQIVSTLGDTLFECVAAPMADADMGNDAANDMARYYSERPELRSVLLEPGTESGTYHPFVCSILEAPVTHQTDSQVDNRSRGWYRNNGRLGTVQIWSIPEDPQSPEQRYNFMTSGEFDSPSSTMDVRMLLASTPFTLAPGDTAHFAVAYTVLDPPVIGTAATTTARLDTTVERLLAWYYSSDPTSGVRRDERMNSASIALLPNPATDRATLRVALDKPSQVEVRIVDRLGRVALVRELGPQSAGTIEERLDLGSLPPGHYVVSVETAEGRSTTPLLIAR